jgi:hypothetical protein
MTRALRPKRKTPFGSIQFFTAEDAEVAEDHIGA